MPSLQLLIVADEHTLTRIDLCTTAASDAAATMERQDDGFAPCRGLRLA